MARARGTTKGVDDGFYTLFGLAWLLAFGVAALAHVRYAFGKPDEDFKLVVTVAAMEAAERKHARVGELHLVLALTCDPAVRARLARIGVLDALRERLVTALAALPPDGADLPSVEAAAPAVQRALAPSVEHLLRRARRRPGHPPSPLALMDQTVRWAKALGGPLAEAFAAVGLDVRAWRSRGAAPARSATRAAGAPSAAAVPYRTAGDAAVPADVAVRLWNDDKTTMQFVVDTLGGRFGLSAVEARYVMLRVHRVGSARAAELARADAERIVAEAQAEARERGFPLELTIEPLVAEKKRRRGWSFATPASPRSG